MTEKYKLEISEPHIEDTETGECYDLCGKDNLEYIVELWNKRVDENRQLKKENQELELLVQDWEALDEEKDEELNKQNQALKKLKKENEQLKKGMIKVVDRYIKNVDCNPPSSAHTYMKIKGALLNIREDLRDLIGDLDG